MSMRTATRLTRSLLLLAFFALCLSVVGCQTTTARGQYDIAVGGSNTK